MGAGLGVLILGLIIFLPVCDWIGGKGALFNPAHNAAFAAMRQGSTQSHVIRIVGHVFSSLTASTGVLIVLPSSFLLGVQLDIAMHCTSLTAPLQHMLCIWSHVKLNKHVRLYTALLECDTSHGGCLQLLQAFQTGGALLGSSAASILMPTTFER